MLCKKGASAIWCKDPPDLASGVKEAEDLDVQPGPTSDSTDARSVGVSLQQNADAPLQKPLLAFCGERWNDLYMIESNLNRRGFLKTISCATGAVALGRCACAAPNTGKPNIVLLFVDDLGWNEAKYKKNHLGMPHVDALAAEGMTFTDAYSASPTCSPSRASVITGQHPARLRMVRHVPGSKDGTHSKEFHTYGRDPVKMPSRNWLPIEEPSLADALKPLGYRTAFVGKWHLGHDPYHPVKHGYDVQFGVSNCGHPRSYHAPYFANIDDTYNELPKGKYLTDQLTDDAVSYIEKQDGKQPFMLTLFYYSAHDPFDASKDMTAELEKANPGRAIHPLASMLGSVDKSVGRISDALKRKNLDSNTVVFFLGDQGGKIPSPPMRGTKRGGQALYEGGARIPFIVKWPGVVKGGTTSSELAVTTDVFPTMLGMVGGDISSFPKLDGKSLVPVLKDGAKMERKEIIMYRSYEDQYAAVRSGKWKYIAYRRGRNELFDLESDLSESKDLSKTMPEKVAELRATLRAFEKKMGVPGVIERREIRAVRPR